MKTKVEGHQNIYKDTDTGVIVNRESSERSRYRIAKQQALMNSQSQDDIKQLTDEVNELKSLIKQLLNR
jgi:hypothetical protein